MAVALLIALVAALDVFIARLRGGALIIASSLAVLAALTTQWLLADAEAWVGFAMLAAACAWFALRVAFGADVAAVWLAIAVAGGLALGDTSSAVAVRIIAIAGVALFLTHPANEVCRALLDRARVPHEGPPAQSGEGDVPGEPEQSTLRGGRFIGPLERLSVTVLALLGAQAVIVGLMAAKGIGRYPELAGDRGHTSKAEEFLIGSLVSWLIAAGAAAYLHTVLT